MKTLKFGALIALVGLMTVSCVEKSAKYQALLAQRDSLQNKVSSVQTEYNQSMDLLSQVDSGFAAISESEASLKIELKGVEGQTSAKKQELAEKFNQLKQVLEENKARVAKLQKFQRENKELAGKNSKLDETIQRMETELAEKTASIEALQAELAKRDVKINELNQTVTGLNSNISSLKDESAKQQSTIKAQDESLNKVWYYIGTSKDLKEAQIVTSNGLFKAKTVMDRDFNKSVFTAADKRGLSSIPTNSKSAKIISNHPADSYTLNKGEDKMITIEILNADKFWSVSKYLVIQK